MAMFEDNDTVTFRKVLKLVRHQKTCFSRQKTADAEVEQAISHMLIHLHKNGHQNIIQIRAKKEKSSQER